MLIRCSEALDTGDADTAFAAFTEFREIRESSIVSRLLHTFRHTNYLVYILKNDFDLHDFCLAVIDSSDFIYVLHI